MTIRSIHRVLSLAVLAIWLVQAVTGTLSVFRWELDESSLGDAAVPVEWTALGSSIDRLAAKPGALVSSVWTSGTGAGRFDVHYAINSEDRVLRVNGQGEALRERSADQATGQGAIWDSITSIHTSLLAGDRGEWLMAISGILLFTNLLLGLKLAWPKRGTWRKTLFNKPVGGSPAKLYGWHRKVGLWFALPALLSVGTGVLINFNDALESGLGASIAEPVVPPVKAGGRQIGLGQAVTTALHALPASTFAGVSLPAEDAPWYRVRVRSQGEVSRKWGASVVYVAAADGRVLSSHDAAAASSGRKFVDALYPLHTGQIGGWAGRLLVLATGATLVGMIVLGTALWAVRRRAKARSAGVRLQPARSPMPGPSRN